jgi:hypothetical protein
MSKKFRGTEKVFDLVVGGFNRPPNLNIFILK